MNDHTTELVTTEPADVVVHADDPADAATATFAELVCADDDLLRAEFDSIVAANFPGPADRPRPCRPGAVVASTTERESHGACIRHPRTPSGASRVRAHRPPARERGPPSGARPHRAPTTGGG